MDPSSLLDETLQDVSNLSAEFSFYLKEISDSDGKLVDLQKKLEQKRAQVSKYIKQNGSKTESKQEEDFNKAYQESIEPSMKLQDQKCLQANTMLFMVSKKLNNLIAQMEKLEESGVLAATDEGNEGTSDSRETSVSTISNIPDRKRKAISSNPSSTNLVKKKKLQSVTTPRSTPKPIQKEASEPIKVPERKKKAIDHPNGTFPHTSPHIGDDNEEGDEDKTLYCFCQRYSFGEMVACDGPNCKYEWFHYGCVNLKEPPKGTWYCPDCQAELDKKKKT